MKPQLLLTLTATLLLAASPGWSQSNPAGYALNFDGVDDYVSVPLAAPPASNYTLSAWVYLRASGTYGGTRMAVLSSTACGNSIELLIRANTENPADPQYLELSRCSAFNGTASTTPVPLTTWTHVAVTVGAGKAVSYFINGNPAGSWSANGLDVSFGNAVNLGDNSGSRRFDGLLDEVQIWNRALTQAEIQANMNQALTGNETGLYTYHRFDEGRGYVTADSSVAGLAFGTLNNGVIWSPSGVTPFTPLPLGSNFALQADLLGTNILVTGFPVTSVAVWGDTLVAGSSVAERAVVFVRSGTNWLQQALLVGHNTEGGDRFGTSVAIFGDTVIVGAFSEDSASNIINVGGSNNNALDSGAAYVFVRQGTNWTQQAYLKSADNASNNLFGVSTALFGDTAVVGVGSPKRSELARLTPFTAANNGAGAAYVFVRSGTNWTQQARVTASNGDYGDAFGCSVGLFEDTLLVGAPGEDSGANTVNGDGTRNDILDAGAAYVFVRQGTNWLQQAYLKASNADSGPSYGDPKDPNGIGDLFGRLVALSGNTVVVTAPYEDSLGATFNDFGDNVGAAYVFVRSGTNWSQQAFLKAPGTYLMGTTVAVSGDTVLVGRGTYVFQRAGTNWVRQTDLPSGGPAGSFWPDPGMAISGRTVVLGSGRDFGNGVGLGEIMVYDSTAPRLLVQDAFGLSLADGTSREMAIQDGQPHSLTFTIRNTGDTNLTRLVITKDGPDAAAFSVTAPPSATLAPGASTSFTVQFASGAFTGFPKLTALHLANNDAVVGTFDLNLQGYRLLSTVDTDGDGLNDVAEFQLSNLGFDRNVSQIPLVNAYFNGANKSGLYTAAQVQALNAGTPLLSQIAPGQFKLTLGVQKATHLTNFSAFPMTAPQTLINGQGNLEFLFTAPDNAAFYRLESR